MALEHKGYALDSSAEACRGNALYSYSIWMPIAPLHLLGHMVLVAGHLSLYLELLQNLLLL